MNTSEKHTLLIITLGPVQQFIGQARRMRDIWFGSHILSELSRAVARHLAVEAPQDWRLVFPAVGADSNELQPCLQMLRDGTQEPPLAVANKVIATAPFLADEAVAEVAAGARNAAIAQWQAFAAQARGRAVKLLDEPLDPGTAPEEVIDSLLQCFAAWSSYQGDGDFRLARQQAERAIAARKTLRQFAHWHGAPYRKSSLDGQRESILKDRRQSARDRTADEPVHRPKELTRRLRLGDDEHLDGIGFVKRAGGDPGQFVPISRIAIQPWLVEVEQAAGRDDALARRWRNLERACRDEKKVPRTDQGPTGWIKSNSFPYDGELFFEDQWPAWEEELDLPDFARNHVAPLFRRADGFSPVEAPHPYVAFLKADGDRMGSILDALATADDQFWVGKALAEFATDARDIVERKSGVLLYAGGDDVLAVLPVRGAVDCAEQLRTAFAARMQEVLSAMGSADRPRSTLSVGIGIGHCLTPMGRLLSLAENAETFAKDGDDLPHTDPRRRNALGILVDKRSGDTIRWRANWEPPGAAAADTGAPPPQALLQQLTALLLERRMPTKLPYQLKDLLHKIDDVIERDAGATSRELGRMWRMEILRILARKVPDHGEQVQLTPQQVHLPLPQEHEARLDLVRERLAQWVGAAMVANALADAEFNLQQVTEHRPRENTHAA